MLNNPLQYSVVQKCEAPWQQREVGRCASARFFAVPKVIVLGLWWLKNGTSFVLLVERVGHLVSNFDSYKYELFVFATPCAFQPFLIV